MARRVASRQVIIAAVALLAFIGVVAAFSIKSSRPSNVAPPPPANNQTTPGQPVTEEPTPPPVNTPDPSAPPPTQQTGPAPAKPTLQKSSSTVPAGALVNFVCEGAINLSCDVILTNQANPSQKLSLGAKAIADNGRGQYFASWNWESKAGSWQVVARATNGTGQSADSDPQQVTVQ